MPMDHYKICGCQLRIENCLLQLIDAFPPLSAATFEARGWGLEPEMQIQERTSLRTSRGLAKRRRHFRRMSKTFPEKVSFAIPLTILAEEKV
eukprot:scaffold17123_cov74-Cyclotella_meneghiniana.AAC.5